MVRQHPGAAGGERVAVRYRLTTTRQFDRDVKRLERRGCDMDRLWKTVDLLLEREPLPEQYRDHALTGDRQGLRDCHVAPDWILIYFRREDKLVLVLSRTGTHSDVF